jgi:NADH-quinone oxidoreductase subunit J
MIETALFYLFASLTTVSAFMVVKARNLFHSALYLAATLFGVAAMYVLLQAYFLAAIQVLIYIGAVVVLTIFVINLTKEVAGKSGRPASRQVFPAVLICLMIIGLVVTALHKSGVLGPVAMPGNPEATTRLIGQALLTDYVIAFEVVSVLLLAALIGGIVIVLKDPEEAP